MKELESKFSAFLWSGPELNTKNAKVAWIHLCQPKSEGGLKLRSLKEINIVNGLKLIWRMLSHRSLWGKWVSFFKTFWKISDKTQFGS